MTLYAKAGSFSITTQAAGNTVSVSGLFGVDVAPKVVFFFWNGRTDTIDALGRADILPGFGHAISTTDRRYTASAADDASASEVARRMQGNAACIGVCTPAGAIDGLADLQSMDSGSGGGFTLVIDDQFTADYTIGYWALAGDEIVNVAGNNFTKATVTGNQDVDQLSFIPNFILFFSTGQTTIDNSLVSDVEIMIGAAKSSSNRYVVVGKSDNGATTSRNARYAYNGECLASFASNPNSGLEDRADFVEFHTNGFRINWLENAGTGKIINYVAIEFASANNVVLGDLLTQTDTTTDIVENGFSFQPSGALFLSHMEAVSTQDTKQNDYALSIGAFNSTTSRLAMAATEDHDAADMICTTGISFDEVYQSISPAGASLDGEMDIKSVEGDGFTNIMDDADPAQKFVWYVAVGSIPAAGGNPWYAYAQQ